MPGRSVSVAIEVYVGRLRRAVNCIVASNALLIASPPEPDGGRRPIGTVGFRGSGALVGQSVALRSTQGGRRGLRLRVSQDYGVIEQLNLDTDDVGRARVRTVAYRYTILDGQERELFAWHWEPEGRGDRPRPHMHVSYVAGPAASISLPTATGVGESPYQDIDVPGLHVSTGRVLLEDVVRFLIEDIGVRGRDGYDAILRDNVRWFLDNRSWEHFDQIAGEYRDGRWNPIPRVQDE